MIRISCTNCKTILSIDDAFAGGVCRCQHCGTIQTVPAQARGNATVSPSGHSIGGSKSLYQNGDPNAAGGGTGLDDLASVVVSSGLASSRLTRSARTAEERGSKQQLLLPVLIGSGVLVIILVFVILYLVMRDTGTNPANPGNGSAQNTGQTGSTPTVTGPSFCGTPITGTTVIYVLDRGQASQDFLGELKDATITSLGSLTADRKFAIIFWNDGKGDLVGYPDNTTAYATKDSIASAKEAIGNVAAYGQTDVKSALKAAFDQHPDLIIIATGKGIDLDSAWVDDALLLRGDSKVKIDTCNLIKGEGKSAPLERLATQTGGTYHDLTASQLRAFGE